MQYWNTCTIGDVCTSVSETYNKNSSHVILINTSDVLNGQILNHEKVPNTNLKGQFKKTFQYNDILYSEIRPANKRFAFVNIQNCEDYIASTKLMVLRSNSSLVLPRFLFAILKSQSVIDELQHLAETRSGTFPQITFSSELAPLQMPLPDIQTQAKIVTILSSLENKIELNTKINNNLEQQAQTLFKSWFVDFEPFGGTMPNDWEERTLTDIPYFKLLKPGIKSFEDEKYYVATADADKDGITNKTTFVTMRNKPSRANMQPLVDSVWFAKMKNSRKNILINKVWTEEINKFILSTGFYGFSCDQNTLYYLWCFIASDAFDELKNNLCNGTTMEAINNDGLGQISLNMPPLEIIHRFDQQVAPMFEKIVHNKFENERLAAIRDALLPKLMSGEIDVSKVDISDPSYLDKLLFSE